MTQEEFKIQVIERLSKIEEKLSLKIIDYDRRLNSIERVFIYGTIAAIMVAVVKIAIKA